jgi:hypothetical protein
MYRCVFKRPPYSYNPDEGHRWTFDASKSCWNLKGLSAEIFWGGRVKIVSVDRYVSDEPQKVLFSKSTEPKNISFKNQFQQCKWKKLHFLIDAQ